MGGGTTRLGGCKQEDANCHEHEESDSSDKIEVVSQPVRLHSGFSHPFLTAVLDNDSSFKIDVVSAVLTLMVSVAVRQLPWTSHSHNFRTLAYGGVCVKRPNHRSSRRASVAVSFADL